MKALLRISLVALMLLGVYAGVASSKSVSHIPGGPAIPDGPSGSVR